MTTSRHLGVVALAFAAFTAACGGSDSDGGPSFSDSVTTVEATNIANSSAETATYLAENLNFGSPSIGAAAAMFTRIQAQPQVAAARAQLTHLRGFTAAQLDWQAVLRPGGLQAVAADGCTYSGHGMWDIPYGEPVDANENGVPDDAAVDIVCTESWEGGGDTLFTSTEELHITMKEIAGSLYGVTFTYRARERYNDNHGNFEQGEMKQGGEIDLRTSTASTDQSMSLEYAGHWGTESYSAGYGEEWGADFDADAAIVYGSALPDGDLNLHGRSFYWDEPEGRNISFSISTPTVLAYNAACALADTNPPFTAGVLLGKLNNSSSQASFEVTFTGCGTYTVAVDNANDPSVVAAQ